MDVSTCSKEMLRFDGLFFSIFQSGNLHGFNISTLSQHWSGWKVTIQFSMIRHLLRRQSKKNVFTLIKPNAKYFCTGGGDFRMKQNSLVRRSENGEVVGPSQNWRKVCVRLNRFPFITLLKITISGTRRGIRQVLLLV